MLPVLLFLFIGLRLDVNVWYWVIFACFTINQFYKAVFGKEK